MALNKRMYGKDIRKGRCSGQRVGGFGNVDIFQHRYQPREEEQTFDCFQKHLSVNKSILSFK